MLSTGEKDFADTHLQPKHSLFPRDHLFDNLTFLFSNLRSRQLLPHIEINIGPIFIQKLPIVNNVFICTNAEIRSTEIRESSTKGIPEIPGMEGSDPLFVNGGTP